YIDADIRNGEALTGMPVSETKKIDNILQRLSDLYSDRELGKNDFTVSELTKINEAISFLEGLLTEEQLSEAYHKAKADGSNPELVRAVEELLGEKAKETKGFVPTEQDVQVSSELSTPTFFQTLSD